MYAQSCLGGRLTVSGHDKEDHNSKRPFEIEDEDDQGYADVSKRGEHVEHESLRAASLH